MRRAAAVIAVFALAAWAATARGGDATPPPYLVRDTNSARAALDEARVLLESGEASQGMVALQRVLDRHRDDLVRVAEDPAQVRWISAPEAAYRLLEAASPAQREAYETAAGPAAAALLREALARRDEARLADAVARYAATSFGVEAARALAESAMESGRPRDAAAAAARGLRFAPRDAGLWLRRIEALEAAGDAEALARIEVPAGLLPAATVAGPVDVAARAQEARSRANAVPPLHDWPAWQGNPAHDAPYPVDHGLRPRRWAAGNPVAARSNDQSPEWGPPDDALRRFEERRGICYPLFPALVDRVLYVADGVSVTALDLYSGRVAWAFPGDAPPPSSPSFVPASDAGALRGRTNLDSVHAPVVAGGLVFAGVEVESVYSPRHINQIEITTYRPRRVLVALDAKTGALRWVMGVNDADRAALARVGLAGPVTVADGLVVAVGARHERRWIVNVMAFEAATGRLRWSRDVVTGQQELNLFGEPVKDLYAGAPAVRHGVVYASTGLGVLAALDLRTGEPVWLSSYEPVDVQRVDLWYTTPLRFPSWGPNAPVVHGDSVVVAPPDGPWLLCLDRTDGRLLWRVAAQSNPKDSPFVDQVLGVVHDGKRDVVVKTGRGLEAFDLATGARAWAADVAPEDGLPRGRGALTATVAYVPTDRGLARYSLRGEGKFLGSDDWPEGVEPGNVLPFPEVLVVAGRGRQDGPEGAIQGFYAWEDLEKALGARRAERPDDPAILVESAEVWRLVGDEARAEDLHRQALRLAEKKGDAAVAARARQGLHRLYLERGLEHAKAGRASDARAALASSLAHAATPVDRVAARLALDAVAAQEGPASPGRVENLEALVREAGEARASFEETGEAVVPVRLGARLRLAALHVAAGAPAAAVDALQAALADDGGVELGDGSARTRIRAEIARIVAAAGPSAYARHEAAARAALEEAAASAGVAAYRRVLDRWPNAAAVPEALLGLAERDLEAGRPADATATLRTLVSAHADDVRVPRALALLSRSLAAQGSHEAARAALSTLERRHGQARLDFDGKTWTGAEFAAAERQRIGPPKPPPPEAAIGANVVEALTIEVDEGNPVGARCVPVARAREGPVPAPVLVDMGSEVVAIDPATAEVRWRLAVERARHAALVGDVLVVAARDVLVAVDPATGDERWRRELPGGTSALDAGGGQVLALVQEPGVQIRSRFVAFDAFTSEPLWSREMKDEVAETLLVAEEAAVVMRRRRTGPGFSVAVSVHSLLGGDVIREIPIQGGSFQDPLLRLADPRTLLVAVRAERGFRVEAYDLPAATRRWSKTLPEGPSRVPQLLPRGDEVVVLDAAGGIRTFALADGAPRGEETRITGGAEVLSGSVPVLGDERLTMLQRDPQFRTSLVAFERKTGRAAWTVRIDERANAGLLLVSGDVLVALVAPRQNQRAGRFPLHGWIVDGRNGHVIRTISSLGLGSWQPSAVLQDGGLVVAGQESVGVFR